jgi:uncharacterized protein YjlB
MALALYEDIKKIAEKVTGWGRPARRELGGLLRARKPTTFRFKDDGAIPNHPRWGLVLYRTPVRFPDALDPAAVLEDLFWRNGWADSWRNGIYDYVHYHARIHEVLGVARGTATVRFGGRKGRRLKLKAGDVAIVPAGMGHQCLGASDDFLVVGAYPAAGEYDECTGTPEERERALRTIPKVPRPRLDPVYGSEGPLTRVWR